MTNTNVGYMRAEELAQWLGLSKRTVAKWQKARVIPHIKIGRVVLFRRSDVEKALDWYHVQPVGTMSRSRSSGDRRGWPTAHQAKSKCGVLPIISSPHGTTSSIAVDKEESVVTLVSGTGEVAAQFAVKSERN